MTRLQLIDGYWYDDRNNRWSEEKYNYNTAQELAFSLSTCNGCTDCEFCLNCTDCTGCTYCTNCTECINCNHCTLCNACTDCGGCEGCIDCEECRRCGTCERLHKCIDCDMCSGFRLNPRRYVGSRIGNTQPTVYWHGRHVLYCEGAFRGTLKQFQRHLADRYKDNGNYFRKFMAFVHTAQDIIRKDREKWKK